MSKQLKLRRADSCVVCKSNLETGTSAWWDATARTVTCVSCHDGTPVQPDVGIEVETELAVGVAGASALARGQALRDAQLARRQKLKEDRPVIGRLAVALAGPATEGETWIKGGIGEQMVGAALDSLKDRGVLVLHDRRIPKSRANIDHIAITPNGVWVIDPKRYSGKVDVVNKGGWFNKDIRLIVNRRDQTKLVAAMHKQRAHVRAALANSEFADAPVYGALCFVDSEWGLFAKPYVVDGVAVSWGKALWPMVTEAGDFDEAKRAVLHRHLAKALPPK